MFDFWGINHSFLLSSEVLESMALLFYLKEIPLQQAPIHHPSWRRMNWLKLPGLQTCLLTCGLLHTSSIGSSSRSSVFGIPLRVLFYQDGTVRTPCWESDHPCKHNDNVVSRRWEKTMLPNSLFLIRVWNNGWEIHAPAHPQSLSIGLHFWALIELGVFLCVWRNSKLKFRILPFVFLDRSSC